MIMKYITHKVAFSCIAVALPLFVLASADPDVLPADAALLSDELDSASDTLSDEVASLQGSATGTSGAGASTSTPPAAAAAEEDQTQFISSIVDAMRPVSGVPPLDNDRFTFYLSDEVLFAQYERSAARYDFENARVHLGFMFTEERDTVFQAGLSLDASFVSSFRLSFGTRLYAALLSDENNDAFAGAIGGELAYQLPFEKLPLELSTSLYYAPDVLTFGQGDRVIDWQIDVTLPFRSQLSVFTGIRFPVSYTHLTLPTKA